MSRRFMDYELAASIVSEIEKRVGRVGMQSVMLSNVGEQYNEIALSRGGLVVAGQSRDENYQARRGAHVYEGGESAGELIYPNAEEPVEPVYRPELAVVGHSVGTVGHTGTHGRDMVSLSGVDSHEYVFTQGSDGLWRAFDAEGNSSDNYWTKSTEFFLDTARPIETDEEGLAIQGLIAAFDAGLNRRIQQAIQEETGLVPQGQ